MLRTARNIIATAWWSAWSKRPAVWSESATPCRYGSESRAATLLYLFPSKSLATTLRLPLHKFETGHPRRTVTETAQVANEPHAQPWQRGRTAGAATSPGFFPARRATCQQTALRKVGSKREAGQRPPRVTQPHLWSKKECTWTWTEKSARRWSSTRLPPLRAIIAAFVLN